MLHASAARFDVMENPIFFCIFFWKLNKASKKNWGAKENLRRQRRKNIEKKHLMHETLLMRAPNSEENALVVRGVSSILIIFVDPDTEF
jgi:hypothetical protein